MFDQTIAIAKTVENLAYECAAVGILAVDRDTLDVKDRLYVVCSDEKPWEYWPEDLAKIYPYADSLKETGENIIYLERGKMPGVICGWLTDRRVCEFIYYSGGPERRDLDPILKDINPAWFDAAYVLAYRQRNPLLANLPDRSFSKTGRLGCGYGFEDICRRMTGDPLYERSYNAIEEAKDLHDVICRTKIPLSAYEEGRKR